MPQMAPMMWILVYTTLFAMILLYLTHFNLVMTPNLPDKKSKKQNKKFKWKF